MKKIDLIQNSLEWHEFRKSSIGASNAPCILWKNPWKTPIRLWKEMLGLIEPETMNEAMQRGVELEPIARLKFEDHVGVLLDPCVVIHPEIPYFHASLDGLSSGGLVSVEIKCGISIHNQILKGKIPEYVLIQLQAQLAVTGLNTMWLYSFDGKDGIAKKIERDNALIEEIENGVNRFYNDWIDLREPSYPEGILGENL